MISLDIFFICKIFQGILSNGLHSYTIYLIWISGHQAEAVPFLVVTVNNDQVKQPLFYHHVF